jgi:hypothetical protein
VDVAAAKWEFVPLAPPEQLREAGFDPIPDISARLWLFLDAYGPSDPRVVRLSPFCGSPAGQGFGVVQAVPSLGPRRAVDEQRSREAVPSLGPRRAVDEQRSRDVTDIGWPACTRPAVQGG